MADDRPIIIIKKKKKGGGDGHHGGAWKVAYADFVTAMMAFFLLLWLLNVTTDEQKFGIANYFDPVSVSRSTSGSGGVLGGKSMIKDGAMVSPSTPMGLDLQMPGVSAEKPDVERDPDDEEYNIFDPAALPDQNNLTLSGLSEENINANEETNNPEQGSGQFDSKELQQMMEAQERENFEKAAAAIREELAKDPELAKLAPHLLIDQTPEGLRIQVIDQEGRSMFASGSAQLYDYTRVLVDKVAEVVKNLPNNIAISGHTDSVPYRSNSGYDNWNLSSDRANTLRKALVSADLPENRIKEVSGKADTQHLVPEEPNSARNRRVSITLLKESISPTGTYDGMTREDFENSRKAFNPDMLDSDVPQSSIGTQLNRNIRPVDALDYDETEE